MAQDSSHSTPPPQRRAAGSVAPCHRVTPGDAGRAAVAWVRSTPGTHIWLLIILLTSGIAALLPADVRSHVLHQVSTNLVELRAHPIRVLIASALWIQSPSGLAVYVVLFEVVHATAERWLGTARWLATAAFAHVGATLLSQKAVFLDIRDNRLPHSLAYTVDIGVSYGLAGVAGVLTYRLPRCVRRPYAVALLGFFGYRLVTGDTFTDLGHFTAVLIGLCCYALTPLPPTPAAHAPVSDGGTTDGGTADGRAAGWEDGRRDRR
ncbi:rhomboid-like protein [Streptomyces sp. NPDC087270]|uniref:rhomboid-like protein n=1 Tax=Streptomyces sp. NPDC087270 TaxID=3365774 RepID=UPI0037F84A6B